MAIDLRRMEGALAHRYRLGEEVGRGGMALVYRATDVGTGEAVAIKFLRPEMAQQLGAVRFLQEIQIESGLTHPNILPVLDTGEVDGLPYYVMPLVAGASLADRLARERQLPVDEAIEIASQVGAALTYAHAQGVIHRDIKPENILLDNGRAMVADFGIARAVARAGGTRITSSGLILGTPAYMSPEQGSGDDLDGRSDQYALACVLHQMLVGEPPFVGPTAQAVIARHARERPPSIEVVRPGVPPHVIAAVEKGLSKSPADRFRSVEALVKALHDPASWTPPARVRTRRRLLAGIGVVAAVAIAWVALSPAPIPLDPLRVIVDPLETRGFAAGDSGAGYDLALMITAGLEHSEPLRGYDGGGRLPATVRARFRIGGVVLRTADSTAVSLRLFDEAGDSLVAQETVTGPTTGSRPYDLATRALVPLLPRILDPGRRVDLSPLMNRRVSAVALWIQGERRYREGRFAAALPLYQRAVAEDSSLVMAAVKGAQAASWTNRHAEAGALAALALRNEELLPRRYASFAKGVAAYWRGEADSALAWFDRTLEDSPDWSEAHMAAGEVAYHLFVRRPVADSFAERAFASARASDPGFLPPAVHLAEIALRRGNLREADRHMRELQASPPDSIIVRQLGLMRSCVAGDLEAAEWAMAALADQETVLRAAQTLTPGGAQLGCAEDAFRVLMASEARSYQWGAFLGLQGILAAQGRREELIALVDSMVAAGTVVARSVYLLNALAGHALDAQARGFEEFFIATYGDSLERLGRTPSGARSRWLMGSWWIREGRLEEAAALQRIAAGIADSLGSRSARLYADGLDAQVSPARGDTAAALARLRALAPNAPRDSLEWDLGEGIPIERLAWARAALAAGHPEEALRAASGFDHSGTVILLAFLPASLELRAQAAEALGRRDLAGAFRARLRTLGARAPQTPGGGQ